MAAKVDHAVLFAATPSPYLVLGPDLMIVEVNRAYAEATGRTREDLVGQHIFQVFPDNPDDPDADGVWNLNASLHRVLATRRGDTMALQKYDIPVPHRPGVFEERWWSPVNTPVLGPDGRVVWIIHRVEDVTAFVKAHQAAHPTGIRVGESLETTQSLEAELYARARELQRLNEELRQAHTREREVAVTLQEAMLHAPDLAHHRDVVVRYLPAVESLNVSGDWYDVVDIPPDRLALAVGDVIGHGLEAAAVTGEPGRAGCHQGRGTCTHRLRVRNRTPAARNHRIENMRGYSPRTDGGRGGTAAHEQASPPSLTSTGWNCRRPWATSSWTGSRRACIRLHAPTAGCAPCWMRC